MSYILGEPDEYLNELNSQLLYKIASFTSQSKKNSVNIQEKVSNVHKMNKRNVTKVNQNAFILLPIQKSKAAANKKLFTFQHVNQPKHDVEEFMEYHANDINKTLHESIDHIVTLHFTLYIELIHHIIRIVNLK